MLAVKVCLLIVPWIMNLFILNIISYMFMVYLKIIPWHSVWVMLPKHEADSLVPRSSKRGTIFPRPLYDFPACCLGTRITLHLFQNLPEDRGKMQSEKRITKCNTLLNPSIGNRQTGQTETNRSYCCGIAISNTTVLQSPCRFVVRSLDADRCSLRGGMRFPQLSRLL